jgi:hypothetical protein
MKQLKFTLWTAIAATILFSLPSCGDRIIIGDTVERVDKQEQYTRELNTAILSIRTLVDAMEMNGSIISVEPFTEDDPPRNGYIITFSDAGIEPIKIYDGVSGETPDIGIYESENICYWKVNGKVLLDKDRNPIRVTAVTPQLRINGETGTWEVSYDEEATWISLGYGSGIFDSKGLEDHPDYVLVKIAGGVEIKLPRYVEPELIPEIDLTHLLAMPVDGATPITNFTGGGKYNGIVEWEPADGLFRQGKVYTATVTLTPGAGYLFPEEGPMVLHTSMPGGDDEGGDDEGGDEDESSQSAAGGNISQSAAGGGSSQSAAGGDMSLSAAGGGSSLSAAGGSINQSVAAGGDMSLSAAAAGDSSQVIESRSVPATGETGSKIWKGKIEFPPTPGAAGVTEKVTDLDLTTKIPRPQEGKIPIREYEWFQYTIKVMWVDTHAQWLSAGEPFARGEKYTAIVSLTAKQGYTFTGVEPASFKHLDAENVMTDDAIVGGGGKTLDEILISFQATVQDKPVNDLNLTLKIPRPVMWERPVTELTMAQYSLTVEWSPEIQPGGRFLANELYIAEIKVTAEEGYTFNANGLDVPEVVEFVHNGGALTTTMPNRSWTDAQLGAWDKKTLELKIEFPVTGSSLPTRFSGQSDVDDSAIDLIKQSAGQSTLDVTIAVTAEDQNQVTLVATEDLGTTGLVLEYDPNDPEKTTSPAVLILNGGGLTVDLVGQPSSGHSLITVGNGVTLTLRNITLKGLNGSPEVRNNAPVVKVSEGGKLILESGTTITENNNLNGAGGIVIEKGGELIMHSGAEISSVVSSVSSGGVEESSSVSSSGGVEVKGKFTMSGGRIRGNKGGNGGGVQVSGLESVFNMEGGDISDNVAGGDGGGVYVNKKGTFTISMGGGKIQNNAAPRGGGVFIRDGGSNFFMDGGMISGNVASGTGGGGVYVDGSTDIFTMNYGATINGNMATTGSGGGVYVNSSFEMIRGTISDNKAMNGGGVHITENGIFTLKDGSINGNQASGTTGGGGVLAAASGTFLMSGGFIYGNGISSVDNATGNSSRGAGVYLQGAIDANSSPIPGRFTKTGGIIYGAADRSNPRWEEKELQNYYVYPIDRDPSCVGADCHYEPFDYDRIPGGPGRGYAIYYDYKGTDDGPLYIDDTLTESIESTDLGNEHWKRVMDIPSPSPQEP